MSYALQGPGFDPDKPRIFQIGFNKCGTRSFYEFLRQNGIPSIHFRRGDLARSMAENRAAGAPLLTGIDRWTGYTDMQYVNKKQGVIEACMFYKELATQYPNSYFVLNTRSKDRWIASRLKHGNHGAYAARYRKGLGLATNEELLEVWSQDWDRHHKEVPEFFAETGQRFLMYNIEFDTPDTLTDFLAPDFKTDPALFGHEGKTEPKPAADAPATPAPVAAPTAAPVVAEPSRLSKSLMPRNDIVGFDETLEQPTFDEVPAQPPAEGSTGNVIIACMKNEGPYLLEWIAFHRAIGFHHFLIYTNDCTDGTDTMLDRLDAMGIVTHVDNTNWQGTSPQVVALNASTEHPVVKNADWIVHIDADEFINIRTGQGTFTCLLNALPDSVTNIAMTWRMFGSAGVRDFADEPVIGQFDRCAPAHVPKPHTAWGFKTATRNIGAYGKIGCHRPNKLAEEFEEKVHWVNGSGAEITSKRAKNGWRSDTKIIGYDLVQLNHYALRSSDSFLVKRQRGRALHVDRSIGESYWQRMDWNTYQDVTIKRNLARLQAEMERLMADKTIAKLHAETVAWHKAKITELKGTPEFADMLDTIHAMKLDDVDRIIAALEEGVEA